MKYVLVLILLFAIGRFNLLKYVLFLMLLFAIGCESEKQTDKQIENFIQQQSN